MKREDGITGDQPAATSAPSGVGTVLASYGRGVLVHSNGANLHCGLIGRKLRPVCGDRVHWLRSRAAGGACVDSVATRSNLFERIDSRGRPEPVAANIDQLAVVVAPLPAADWFLVDRYLAGALLAEVAALLIVNKADLDCAGMEAELAVYGALPLRGQRVSTASGAGLEALRAALAGRITLMVGQSGVGKSSLVNALIPLAAAQTAELTRDSEGRHTTTTARWYRLGAEGAVIDAPGVRDFAPPAQHLRAAQRGFSEVLAASAHCKFNDCRHFQEPGCGVRSAVSDGRIAARRYESYRRLARLYEGFPAH